MDELKEFLGITNIIAQYPFVEKLVLVCVVIVFANKKVKDRFKKIDEDKEKAEIQRKQQTDAMAELTGVVKDLGKSLNEQTAQSQKRMAEGEKKFDIITAELLDHKKFHKDINRKMLAIETRLQLYPIPPDLTDGP